jgi:hypothetical protein
MQGNIDVAHEDFVATTTIMGVAFPKASIQ